MIRIENPQRYGEHLIFQASPYIFSRMCGAMRRKPGKSSLLTHRGPCRSGYRDSGSTDIHLPHAPQQPSPLSYVPYAACVSLAPRADFLEQTSLEKPILNYPSSPGIPAGLEPHLDKRFDRFHGHAPQGIP